MTEACSPPVQKAIPWTKNPQQNKCPNNVQPLVPMPPENGNPQQNIAVNINQLQAFNRPQPNLPEA